MAKRILLTGATGIMGSQGLRELLKSSNNIVTILVRRSIANRKKLNIYRNNSNLKIIWGNLCNFEDVCNAVEGNEIILHVGGMVSPKADKYPELTLKTNISAAQNIVNAVKLQKNSENIKIVYIGSIAQLGNKEVPHHFGGSGDLLNPSIFDHYAVSKIMAERIFAESGLTWVSLRQTGILYPELVKNGINPITFHVPLRGVLEWATVEDSGRLLAKVCKDNIPDDFWKNFYNISSGKSYRLTNYEFECKFLNAIYCPPPEKIFESNWFALKNFHGCWYSDANVLENYLHFRNNMPCDDYFTKIIRKKLPWYFKFVKIVPAGIMKNVMKRITYSDNVGTMNWIKNKNTEKINVYFGSYENWENIPTWDKLDKSHPSEENENLYIKYNVSKPTVDWDIEYMKNFANYRNGKCLSDSMIKGDISTPLTWCNADGDKFEASPRYVIMGGFFPDHRLWIEIENAKKLL